MASEYSLADIIERIYENQLALEVAVRSSHCGLKSRGYRGQTTISHEAMCNAR